MKKFNIPGIYLRPPKLNINKIMNPRENILSKKNRKNYEESEFQNLLTKNDGIENITHTSEVGLRKSKKSINGSKPLRYCKSLIEPKIQSKLIYKNLATPLPCRHSILSENPDLEEDFQQANQCSSFKYVIGRDMLYVRPLSKHEHKVLFDEVL